MYGPLTDAQRHAVERAQAAARHLRALVDDLLDLARLEAGRADLAIEPVAVGPFVEELAATVRPIAEQHGCELRVHVDPGLGTLTTDPRRLRQILWNFLENAFQYAAGRTVDLEAREADDRVRFLVRDRGPGLAEEEQRRIFDEFVRGGHGTGTGLGLTIARALATLLGGEIGVESRLGEGSCFWVALPLDGAPSSQPARSE